MTEQFRMRARPGTPSAPQGSIQPQVQARVQDRMGAMPQVSDEARGLMEGLSSLMPGLQKDATQREKDDIVNGQAWAEQQEAPEGALRGSVALPEAVSPTYRTAALTTLANRAGIEIKARLAAQAEELMKDPTFNRGAWLREQRQTILKDFNDPESVAVVGRHILQLEDAVTSEGARQDAMKRREALLDGARKEALGLFSLEDDVPGRATSLRTFISNAEATGISKPEALQIAIDTAAQVSLKGGGMPELFDAFEESDGEMPFLQRGKETAGRVAAARAIAQKQRDQAISEETALAHGKWLAQLEIDIDTEPEKVLAPGYLDQFFNAKTGPIETREKYASYYGRAHAALRRKLADKGLSNLPLDMRSNEDQQKIMDQVLGPSLEKFIASRQAGDQQAMNDGLTALISLQTQLGATVPYAPLQRMLKGLLTSTTQTEGPPPGFLMAAEVWKRLGSNPSLRDQYFPERDQQDLLRAYTSMAGGSGTQEAYHAAMLSIDPATKEQAEKYVGTKEFRAMADKAVQKAITGSSMWIGKLWGGAGRPEAVGPVSQWAGQYMKNFVRTRPNSTDEEREEAMQSAIAKNWVLDKHTGMPVKISERVNPDAAREAIEAYMGPLKESVQGYLGEDWYPVLRPTGNESSGGYMVVATNGDAVEFLGSMDLPMLMEARASSVGLTAFDRQALRAFVAEGTPLPAEVLGKAESLGLLTPAQQQKAAQQFRPMSEPPQMDLGKPSNSALLGPVSKTPKVDHKLTAQVSQELFANAREVTGFAAALITAGEGVMLQAYDDPNPEAGKNIAMGYNLKANAKTVREDLKRAKVPPERIDDVIEGRAALTTDQAIRLTYVAMPRYIEEARKAAEATKPGLWDSMTPQQQAVMVDLSWQVGDTDQFKQAWAAVADGDNEALARAAKVTFKGKDGVRKPDTRRNDLRASMLLGGGQFGSTLVVYGRTAKSPLQQLSTLN